MLPHRLPLLLTAILIPFAIHPPCSQAWQAGLKAGESAQTDRPSEDISPTQEETQGDRTANETIGVTFSNPVRAKWKVGVQIVGGSTTVRNVFVTIPVPNDWPEQTVAMVDEDIPAEAGNVKFRDLECGVKQLMLTFPVVRAREQTVATMTFLVSTSQINPPADTSLFVAPKSNNREAKLYLGVSPNINYRDSKLRKQVKELVADKPNIWEETKAIFEWVGDNIEQREAEPSAIDDVFKQKSGCAEDRVALFVGMCRANKIPARMVWVEGTQYAEFMLSDAEKNSYWFPCNVNGIREFGSISDPRIILQKGESIRVPEKEDRQKFVAEFAAAKGRSKPSIKFIRQLLPADR